MVKVQSKSLAQTLYQMVDGKSNRQAQVIIKKFVGYLAQRGILSQGKTVASHFSGIYDKNHGITTAKIISSGEVSENQIGKIKSYVKQKYNYDKVELERRRDPKIGKGLKVMIDDLVIDLTLDSRVKRLREYLIKNI